MKLRLDESELVACVGCGLCLPHCPTYRVTGDELTSPRGRIAAMLAVSENRATVDATFHQSMDTCIQCRACEAACPSGVQFGHLMEDTRRAQAPERPWPRRVIETIAYRGVLPRRRVLAGLTRLTAVAQRARLVPKRFGLPLLPLRSPAPLVSDPAPDAFLFTGCVMDAWQRDTHRAALRVMRATGARVGLPDPGADCCGALHIHAGRHDDAVRLATRVMRAFPGTAPIVVDSAGCGAALLDYGRLLGTPEAVAFSERVVDFSSFVRDRGVTTRPGGPTVVVQDPCHLRHVQKTHLAVGEILGAAYDVRVTADDGLCCGAGGAFSVFEPDLSNAVRDRKVAALRSAAGTDQFIVASANPGCAMHLAAAGLDVRHPAELLEDRLGPD
ncbi:MAG: (Fe-S)-binding protein [Acidimicrobiia bacterium]|nr:(Fe-S)-binding protein [Acidimicrobiia bacterium]